MQNYPNSACTQITFFVHAAILRVHIWRWGVLDHLVRKTYHIYIHSDPNSGSGPPCTKNIPHLHTLGPQFCMYEKHTTSTYTRTSILYNSSFFAGATAVFGYHIGGFWHTLHTKTYQIYIHSDPNCPCTQNTPGLHTLGPQFCKRIFCRGLPLFSATI